MADVIRSYLGAVASQDWERMRSTIRDDVVRIGPYGDVYEGQAAYVEFLSKLMPTLPGYSMDVTRVTYLDNDRRAIAELSETVTIDDAPLVTPEVLLFDLDAEARIARIEIFTRRA